jgi:hypothetical protein
VLPPRSLKRRPLRKGGQLPADCLQSAPGGASGALSSSLPDGDVEGFG